MSRLALLGAALLGGAAAALAGPPGGLKSPFRVQAGGTPIDVEVGHAAPLLRDLDGDGKPDLLVGQFGGGKLRLYRNTGTREAPAFGEFAWFEAGGTAGSVPAG